VCEGVRLALPRPSPFLGMGGKAGVGYKLKRGEAQGYMDGSNPGGLGFRTSAVANGRLEESLTHAVRWVSHPPNKRAHGRRESIPALERFTSQPVAQRCRTKLLGEELLGPWPGAKSCGGSWRWQRGQLEEHQKWAIRRPNHKGGEVSRLASSNTGTPLRQFANQG